jgi:hypothetical protein
VTKSTYDTQVFVNCPFDGSYKTLFEALVFAIADCGFRPRCALESEDSGQVRMDKIFTIISGCRFGIHDISRTELDSTTALPRFNMPLELGIFLGARRYGPRRQQEKNCLILDRDRYRYQKFISDIAGQDIREHGDDPKQAVTIVRNWLRSTSPEINIPGGEAIWKRYRSFRSELPKMCKELKLVPTRLTFRDYSWLVSAWIRDHLHSAS